ncbi:TetR family transcriptional regulator [Rhodococcoides corynebacterioides]|uniref:TetR family transcriptional regulator n=1 Tax=Rhodococcoides corynebacterioides TaxID=53972 RepID=UPI003ADD7440
MKSDTTPSPAASATRERILIAARREFAEHGLAGARVDRIALASRSSKERLYAYYGDKERLFGAALDHGFRGFVEAVEFTPRDLPGYAMNAFTRLASEKDEHRMLLWAQLQGHSPATEHSEVMQERVREVEQAQRDGYVDSHLPAADLMTVIFGVLFSWFTTPDLGQPSHRQWDDAEIARRRLVVGEAVRKVAEPRAEQ